MESMELHCTEYELRGNVDRRYKGGGATHRRRLPSVSRAARTHLTTNTHQPRNPASLKAGEKSFQTVF